MGGIMYHCIATLVVQVTTVAAIFYGAPDMPPGIIHPPNALVTEGGHINISCSYKNQSSLLYFTLSPARGGSLQYNLQQFTSVIDDDTIRLYIANVNTTFYGVYHCYQKSNSTYTDQYIGYANVIVGKSPTEIKSLSCVSHNFADLVCSWCPPEFPNMDETTRWRLEYKISSEKTWTSCSDVTSSNQCVRFTFGIACKQLYKFVQYDLVLGVNTTQGWQPYLGITSLKLSLNSVKPNPVTGLKVTILNSSSAAVWWGAPTGLEYLDNYQELHYQLNVSGEDEYQVVNLGTRKDYTVVDLHPYAAYNFSVTSKPGSGGYWSNPMSTMNRTSVAAPSTPPPQLQGFYKYSEDPSEVFVYWQAYPARQANGPVPYYTVTVSSPSRTKPLTANVPGFTFKTALESAEELTVNLSGVNIDDRGVALPSPPSTLHINRNLDIPSPIIWLSEKRSDGSFVIQWIYDGNASFIIFSCQPDNTDENVCKSSPDTITITNGPISDNLYEYTVVQYDAAKVYGIAANSPTNKSSGLPMKWLPACNSEEEPRRPTIGYRTDGTNLTVTWQGDCRRGQPDGTVLGYEVLWTAPGGTTYSSGNLTRLVNSYTIKDVMPGQQYSVAVTTIGRNKSSTANMSDVKIPDKSKTHQWIIIGPSVTAAVLIIAGILFLVINRGKKLIAWYRKWKKLEITTPEKDKLVPGTPSEQSDVESFQSTSGSSVGSGYVEHILKEIVQEDFIEGSNPDLTTGSSAGVHSGTAGGVAEHAQVEASGGSCPIQSSPSNSAGVHSGATSQPYAKAAYNSNGSDSSDYVGQGCKFENVLVEGSGGPSPIDMDPDNSAGVHSSCASSNHYSTIVAVNNNTSSLISSNGATSKPSENIAMHLLNIPASLRVLDRSVDSPNCSELAAQSSTGSIQYNNTEKTLAATDVYDGHTGTFSSEPGYSASSSSTT